MKNIFLTLIIISFCLNAYSQSVQANMPGVNDAVNTIVRYNDVVYIGGEFTMVGSTPRRYLAAIDANTGAILPWDPSPNNYIEKMIIANNRLVVGGDFDTISNANVKAIAVFDLPGGSLLNSTIGNITYAGSPGALQQVGNYIYFLHYDSIYTLSLRRFNINSLLFDPIWSSDTIGYGSVNSISFMDNYIYAGGDFTYVNGNPDLEYLSRFNISTGHVDTTFHPIPSSLYYIYEILAYKGKIYIVGIFNQNGIAEVDTNGVLINNSFGCYSNVNHTVVPQGNTLWIGGISGTMGFAWRNHVAQIEINTGYATCWDVSGLGSGNSNYIKAIYVSGDTIYTGSPNFSNFYNPFRAFVGNPSYVNLSSKDTVLCAGNSFTVYADTSFQTFLWSTGATTSSITISAIGNYCVTATGINGCHGTSCINVYSCTGIENNSKAAFIKAIPTISSGNFMLQFPSQNVKAKIEICNVNGVTVHREYAMPFTESKQIDVTSLPAGIYFCQMLWDNGLAASIKLIKE